MYKKKFKGEEHSLYSTLEEFYLYHDKEIKPKYWREGKTGDWVTSDDGQVCEILRSSVLFPKQQVVTTLFGTYRKNSDVKMEGEPIKHINRIREWQEPRPDKAPRRKHPTGREILFAKYIVTGIPVEEAYVRAFPTDNLKFGKIRGLALLAQERIQKLITKELRDVLGVVGITEEYLLKEEKKEIDKGAVGSAVRQRAIEACMKILNMFPETKRISESLTVYHGLDPDRKKAIESGEFQQIAEAKAEIDK